jgi:isoleucyl-tRNA synthetase
VLGLMLGEDGQKMSKSKRNYREPNEIFDKYGADALRWYFFANQPPWTSIRYSEQSIKDSIPEFLLRLWNVYSFFVIYANIDEFDPAAALRGVEHSASGGTLEQLTPAALAQAGSYRAKEQRGELDRWILGELDRTSAGVIQRMDEYDNFGACALITEFVDALSNWYVRRSRDRFWSEDKRNPDKLDAYWTLYECLIETSKLIAPFTPFLAESLWQNLAVAPFGERVLASVHLCDYPCPAPLAEQDAAASKSLSEQMALVREIVSLGRAARMGAKLKVRQPLAKVEVILADRRHSAWLETHAALIAEELNVKKVEFSEHAEQYISYTVLPDLKRLGPRIGKRLPALKAALAKADAAELLAKLEAEKAVSLELPDGPLALDSDDLQIRLQAKPGWAAAQGHGSVVVLATEISPELALEGIAREVVHAVQTARKDIDCQYTDRIEVGMVSDDKEIGQAVERFGDYIARETLAARLVVGPLAGCDPIELKIGGVLVKLFVKVVKATS